MPTRKKSRPAAKKKPAVNKKAKVVAKKKKAKVVAQKKKAKPIAKAKAKAAAKKPTAKKPTAKKPTVKKSSDTVLKGLPVLWSHKGSGQAIGIHLDDNEVWAGWEHGDVVACSHDGEILRRWKLPSGVDALVADEAWRYAGCHDGNVYDLTGRAPRVAYEVKGGARIHWVDVYRGNVCASDAKGNLSVADPDGNALFTYTQKGGSQGWMARADSTGVYLGNSHGVTKVDWTGKKVWHTKTAWVGFGWQELDRVFVFTGAYGVNEKAAVQALDKETGKIVARGDCWSTEKHYHAHNNAASCAAGRGGKVMYGGTCDTLFCFDVESGALLWETPLAVGAPCSMAYHVDGDGNERLFVVTGPGNFACLDISEAAVEAAKKAPPKVAKSKTLATVKETERVVEDVALADAGKGVIVECIKEGGKLRVKVVSPGYHADWFCQFPKDIREEGARYVVDEVREASQGGFYRVLGDIKRLREPVDA